MTRIKICGIRETAHAIAAAEAGADYIGMVLAPSRRQIEVEQAAKIVAAVKSSSRQPPKLVGVFTNALPVAVKYAIMVTGLDMVQLSGDEDEEYVRQIEAPIIKTMRVGKGFPARTAGASLHHKLLASRLAGALPLLDAQVEGQYGGSGQTFDWAMVKDDIVGFDFLLAGGLTAQNVAGAIAQLHPWGVDVSTGVETEGVKDVAKIQAFIQAAKAVG